MQDEATSQPERPVPHRTSPLHVTGRVCAAVILISILACVGLAAVRSRGLTAVTVTALAEDQEPRDHRLPLVKRKEALPDYELLVLLRNGDSHRLGARPDTSAVEGLTWTLPEPVSVAEVASVRLQEQDKLISDVLAEVQVVDESVSAGNYRFDFATAHSMSVGIRSFFTTPVGKAIATGICIALILGLFSIFADFA